MVANGFMVTVIVHKLEGPSHQATSGGAPWYLLKELHHSGIAMQLRRVYSIQDINPLRGGLGCRSGLGEGGSDGLPGASPAECSGEAEVFAKHQDRARCPNVMVARWVLRPAAQPAIGI